MAGLRRASAAILLAAAALAGGDGHAGFSGVAGLTFAPPPPLAAVTGSPPPIARAPFAAAPVASAPVDAEPALEAMIGQTIVIGFPGTRPDEAWPRRVAGMIRDSRIGGVILFSHNVEAPGQVKALNQALKAAAGVGVPPPFICVDQEGGKIQRLPRSKGFTGLPAAVSVAAMDDGAAYDRYLQAARELADLGFNLNLGPVVDLNINPGNPTVGALRRSYGRDPEKVTSLARTFIRAHRDAGVLAAAKHFPGLGSAAADPHFRFVDVSSAWRPEEMQPFVNLTGEDGPAFIMVAHLVHPRFSDAGDVPASLSGLAIGKELRRDLGYRGLVVTDDLEMGAIARRYTLEGAAVLALAAGADVLIVANTKDPDPGIADRIIGAVMRAVREDRIPVANIRDAYQRIVAVKGTLARRPALPPLLLGQPPP